MYDFSWKFIAGLVLLTTNQIFGWGGMLFFCFLAKKLQKKIFYTIGTVIYALSWAMAGLGMVLAGPEGVELSKKLFRMYGWKAAIVVVVIAGGFFYIWIKKRRKAALNMGGVEVKNA